jgi:hypothetical protein
MKIACQGLIMVVCWEASLVCIILSASMIILVDLVSL